MSSDLNSTSSKELFAKYDRDRSGFISFDEFALLLSDLGFHFKEAKQIEYFRLCDQDEDGSIDFEEFRLALFVCDENENKEAFNPGNLLRPRDAFNLFDKDSTGSLDEDEFRVALETLGIDIDDETHVNLLLKYDKNNSGVIEYNEFKRVWLTLVNPRKELDHRGIHIPTLTTHNQMVHMLEAVLNKEEERESKAIEKAKEWVLRQKMMKNRKDMFQKAMYRYCLELSASLDLAGQVYIFGDGTSNHFKDTDIESEESSHTLSEGNGLLRSLWLRKFIEPPCGINVKRSTFDLWGKEPIDIGFTDSSMAVLCSRSKLYSWDSSNQRWNHKELNKWQPKISSNTIISDSNTQNDVDVKENVFEIDDDEVIKHVLQYFSKWKAPSRNCNFHKHAHSILRSSISREELAQSVELRGMNSDGLTKLELVKLLQIEFKLEHQHLGQESFLELKKIEEDISSLRALHKKKMLKRKLIQFSNLRKYVKEAISFTQHVNNTVERGDNKVDSTKTCISEDVRDEDTSIPKSKWISLDAGTKYVGIISEQGGLLLLTKSNTNEKDTLDLPINSELGEKVVNFSCGHSHSAFVTENGELFAWGSSSTNKLGIKSMKSSDIFIEKPSKVPIPSVSVTKVSCGPSHTGCVTSHGNVFMWGNNSGYRLGLGDTADRNVPTLAENILDHDVYDISCGYCQTMLITKIEYNIDVHNGIQFSKVSGGKLLVAGPSTVLGLKFPSFGSYTAFLKDSNQIEPVAIKQISCGFSHQSAVSIEGELFTFGDNTGGCCGHPLREKFLSIPTHVKCLFNSILNPLSTKRFKKSIPYCYQAYYEADLDTIFTIEKIKIWNYLDSNKKSDLGLFPYWIMISQEELPGLEGSLDSALNLSVSKQRFEENVLVTTWNPPIRTRGRYIRLQLEGTSLLEFKKIEIFGTSTLENPIGRVSKAVCGKRLTGVIIKATDDENDIEHSQERVNAAKIMKSPDQYDSMRCILCEACAQCEICKLKETMIKEGLTWEADSDLIELGKIFLNSQNY